MMLDRLMLYLGFISTAYLTYMILSYTARPATRPIPKEADKYGDDHQLHVRPKGAKNYSENTDVKHQKHLKINGGIYEIDPNQYSEYDYN